jgi:hypothetical protein
MLCHLCNNDKEESIHVRTDTAFSLNTFHPAWLNSWKPLYMKVPDSDNLSLDYCESCHRNKWKCSCKTVRLLAYLHSEASLRITRTFCCLSFLPSGLEVVVKCLGMDAMGTVVLLVLVVKPRALPVLSMHSVTPSSPMRSAALVHLMVTENHSHSYHVSKVCI